MQDQKFERDCFQTQATQLCFQTVSVSIQSGPVQKHATELRSFKDLWQICVLIQNNVHTEK